MTEIIKENDPESPRKASFVLKSGGVIVYPTETLYGVGAFATDENSVEKVFNVKGRFYGKPIPILVGNKEMLAAVAEVTGHASVLIDKFLPGPLTLILRQRWNLPGLITAGTGKVAVRISRHPFVTRLFDLIDEPLTSTSANISGDENLFSFDEVCKTFKNKVDLIVDSGNLPPSKGSTIVDLTVTPPAIVRAGDIGRHRLEELMNLTTN